MAEDFTPDMDVIITANFQSGKLKGINYNPGFAVVSRNQAVRFKTEATEGQDPSVLIVFPNGTPFGVEGENAHAKFIVRCGEGGSSRFTVRPNAELKSYHYVVGIKVGDQALIDGGCPEIFVDI
jgi:hypothetical protein